MLAQVQTFFTSSDLFHAIDGPLALTSDPTDRFRQNAVSLAGQTIRTSFRVERGAVLEELAEAELRKEGEPVALLFGVAKVEAREFVRQKFTFDVETVSAFASLEAAGLD